MPADPTRSRTHRGTGLLLVVLVVSAFVGASATLRATQPEDPSASTLGRADAAFGRGAYAEAVDLYRAALAEGVDHAFVHFRLGYSLHVTGRVDEALPHHLRGVSINNREIRVDCLYNAACAHSLLGRPDEALRYLQYAIDAGFSDKAQAARDTDLDALRDDARFQALIDSIGVEPRLFEQLDLLLGRWEHVDEQGQRLVYRFERPLHASATINYIVTNPRLGWVGSIVPNPVDRTWELTYANAIGTTYRFVGRFDAGRVTFEGAPSDIGGAGIAVRVEYRLDESGNLVEHAQVQRDGRTWESHHEITLTRVEAGEPGAGGDH